MPFTTPTKSLNLKLPVFLSTCLVPTSYIPYEHCNDRRPSDNHRQCNQIFRQGPVETEKPKENEDESGKPFYCPFGDVFAEDDAADDAHCVGDEHARCRAEPDLDHAVILGGQSDRCELGLIAHFRQEKGYGNGPEGAEIEPLEGKPDDKIVDGKLEGRDRF